jgi:hypothetical protein
MTRRWLADCARDGVARAMMERNRPATADR